MVRAEDKKCVTTHLLADSVEDVALTCQLVAFYAQVAQVA